MGRGAPEALMSLAMALIFCSSVQGITMDATATSSLSFDMEAAKKRPVSKVITLLKDMLKQMEKEAEEDEEIFDKIACWCETNDKIKTKAIKDAEVKITILGGQIEALTALIAGLKVQIKSMGDATVKFSASLDAAVSIRFKELEEFNAKEKDLISSIEALKSAIIVLSKHHDSLLQLPHDQARDVANMLGQELEKHAGILKGVLSHKQRRTAESFSRSNGVALLQENTDYTPAHAAASGEIYGILKQMLETFQGNLADLQDGEAGKIKGFGEMKLSLKLQISSQQEMIDKKEVELATALEKLAALKIDLLDTQAMLKADTEYLKMLKGRCANIDNEWEMRQKMRAEEMAAVSKALAVLSGDAAHDLFKRTFNPSMIQTESMNHKELQSKASSVLKAAAKRMKNPRLALLALHVRLDAFTKVKKAINDMIGQLLQEKQDEIKKKDFCVAEFNKNALDTEKKEYEKKNLVAKIDDLKMTIETLTKDIEQLNAEIAEMELELKKAGENRDAEHKDFQMTVADQQATQKLLKMALAVLRKFYAGGEGSMARKSASLLHHKSASLLHHKSGKRDDPTSVVVEVNVVPAGQKPEGPAGPPPPPGFKPMKKNEKSGGVMYLLETIIRDAKTAEEEAVRDDAEAQAAYEDFVKETSSSIAGCKKEIVNKSQEKAKAEEALTTTEQMLENVEVELEELNQYLQQLHSDCDFLVKNFEARQGAREEEIEALKTALSILSGAKFDAFLQGGRF